MKGVQKVLKFAGLLVIVSGYFMSLIVTERISEPVGGAIGILFILFGFHFLINLRVARLEEEVKAIKGKTRRAVLGRA